MAGGRTAAACGRIEAPVPTPQIVHTPDRATRGERNSGSMPGPTLTDGFFAGANEAAGSACR